MKSEVIAGIALVLLASIAVAGCVSRPAASPTTEPGATVTPETPLTPIAVKAGLLSQFASWDELKAYLASAADASTNAGVTSRNMMAGTIAAPMAAGASGKSEAALTPDYSATNVQVAGVDEADTVKTDGKYIYTIANGQIVILGAYPPSGAKIVATINDTRYDGLFVYGGKLVAFGSGQVEWNPLVRPFMARMGIDAAQAPAAPAAGAKIAAMPIRYPGPYYGGDSVMNIFDISDPSAPALVKNVTFQGSYVTSRLINGIVYSVYTSYAGSLPVPVYAVGGAVRELAPNDISYIPMPPRPGNSMQYTTVLGVKLDDLNAMESRMIVLAGGYSQNVYVSQDNAYITYTDRDYYDAWDAYAMAIYAGLPDSTKANIAAVDAMNLSKWRKDNMKVELAQDYIDGLAQGAAQDAYGRIGDAQDELSVRSMRSERTAIHKLSLGSTIEYTGGGSVPGTVLNQFSMDEAGGYFRIATTSGHDWGASAQDASKSGVYVLNSTLAITGSIEGLAPGEQIYSARFLGNRAYLVTFKQLDPLFVVGLEDPAHPVLLGELKIPGYSDYLHPFDQTHLIGFGKDAVPLQGANGTESALAFPTGLKLSLFDVSDVANPRETAAYRMGDAGSDSYALSDHHAFLFDAARSLLVIPVTIAEVDKAGQAGDAVHVYGTPTFQGAYVFNATLDGFTLRGKVSHTNSTEMKQGNWYYWGASPTNVRRSLYIGDNLYTVSDSYVKANDLDSLAETASVRLPSYGQERVY